MPVNFCSHQVIQSGENILQELLQTSCKPLRLQLFHAEELHNFTANTHTGVSLNSPRIIVTQNWLCNPLCSRVIGSLCTLVSNLKVSLNRSSWIYLISLSQELLYALINVCFVLINSTKKEAQYFRDMIKLDFIVAICFLYNTLLPLCFDELHLCLCDCLTEISVFLWICY